MPIPQFPEPPSRGDLPADFIRKADAFLASFPSFVDAINALGTALNLSTNTTSSSNVTIGTGSKVFTVPSGLGYVPGNPVSVASTASPLNNMFGTVNSYSGTTLTVSVTTINGSGTFAAWSIALSPAGSGASLGSNTFTGSQNFALGADIAAAASVNLTTATGNTVHITGNTGIGAFTLGAGMTRFLMFTGTPLLTHNAGTMFLNANGGNVQIEAGDTAEVSSDGSVVYVNVTRKNGSSVTPASTTQGGSIWLATTALIQAGVDALKAITPAGLLAAIGFSNLYQSTGQTITSGGALTLAHGLTREPKHFQYYLLCTSPDVGYAVNDKISINNWASGQGFSCVPDATNLNIRFSSAAPPFSYFNKSSGASVNLTSASWQLYIRAWG